MSTGDTRPIGYWLKRLDRAIDAAFAASYESVGLDRRSWQVLAILAERPATTSDVSRTLEPFWTGDESAADVLHRLAARGLVEGDASVHRLTPDGRSAHERALAAVTRVRSRLADGVSPERYAQTVDTLRLMCANLDESFDASNA